jgi:hypothetical protein
MRTGVPLRLKPTDWESVFRSTKEEFCRPRSVRPLLQRRTKIHNRTSCRLRLMACRARGSGPTTRHSHAKRAGFQFTRQHANCYYLLLTCNGRLHKLPGAFESIHTSRLLGSYRVSVRALAKMQSPKSANFRWVRAWGSRPSRRPAPVLGCRYTPGSSSVCYFER